MKPKNRSANHRNKAAQSRQSQTGAIGRIRQIDPSKIPAFLYEGRPCTARPGTKLRLTVLEIISDSLRPKYERGDFLQLDTETPLEDDSANSRMVVAKIDGVKGPILGRLGINQSGRLARIFPIDLTPGLGWFKRSMFEFIYPVVGMLRLERDAWDCLRGKRNALK